MCVMLSSVIAWNEIFGSSDPEICVEVYASYNRIETSVRRKTMLHLCFYLTTRNSPVKRGTGTMEPSSSGSALQQQGNEDEEVYAQTVANLTLLDPARWGWSAVGGVVDLLPPHEVSTHST